MAFGTTIIAVPSYFVGEKPLSPPRVQIEPTANLTDMDRRKATSRALLDLFVSEILTFEVDPIF